MYTENNENYVYGKQRYLCIRKNIEICVYGNIRKTTKIMYTEKNEIMYGKKNEISLTENDENDVYRKTTKFMHSEKIEILSNGQQRKLHCMYTESNENYACRKQESLCIRKTKRNLYLQKTKKFMYDFLSLYDF